MKAIVIVAGLLVVVLVLVPVIETTPPPHTVEPSYPTDPVPTLVVSFTGSYTPVAYCSTGSWA